MTYTQASFGWLAMSIVALGACSIDSPQAAVVEESTSSTQQAGFFDHFDWCEWFGWYGDGERCDAFCPKPDPDCEPEDELCGGLAGFTCGDDEYCDYEPDSACLTPDATGTCAPRPDFCTTEFDPVCGCDGQTYSNACNARAAGTEVASEGPCDGNGDELCASDDDCAAGERCTAGEEDCLPPPGCEPGDPCPAVCYGFCVPGDGDELCGGLAGFTCGDDEYCDYEPDSACLTPDATGTCAPRPDVCPAIYDPVCGCDGQTYGNACEARAAGTEVASEGPCDGGGDVCGGLGGAACDEDQWCDFPGNTCGAADEMGTCEPIPESCFDIYQPVCGCDDVTYANECFAHLAGVDIVSEGECEPTPTCAGSCGGQSPAGCWCDARCTYFGDCCPDVDVACR